MRYLINHKEFLQSFLILAIFFSFFVFGHAVMSIAIITLFAFSLLLAWYEGFHIQYRSLPFLILVYYLFLCISGVWATDIHMVGESLRIKSSLLAVSFSFLILPKLSRNQITWITKWLTIAIIISAIYVLYHYLENRESILKTILQGHPIPVPFRSHIRYNILLNFCLILTIYQTIYHHSIDKVKLAGVYASASFLLYGFILFLSVKIGILISSFVLVSFFGNLILRHPEYRKYTIPGAIFLILMSFGLYLTMPSIQNKVKYFRWDLQQYFKNDSKNYSDGDRITTIRHGIAVIESSPILGVGEGNIRAHIPKNEDGGVKLPHNQFVMTWAQNGIIGFILFSFIFIYSGFTAWKSKNLPLLTYTGSLFFACMVEPMIETQLGVAIFVLPLLVAHAIQKFD